MNIIKRFRRRSPAVKVQQLSREEVRDLLILRWHGLTPEQWNALPAIVKVDHREAYYRAMGMAS